MESLLIIVIGLAAAAAVAYPLVRSTNGASDPHLDPDPSIVEATDARSAGAVGAPEVEREIMRYREAVRAGTVCGRCRAANREGSRFCSDCGQPLKPTTRRAGA
jgi:hypothetical protein